jgi:hypothetical protein
MWIAPVSDYDTCYSIIYSYSLSRAESYAMNPTVKSDCSGLARGTNYYLSTYPGGFPVGFPGWKPASSSAIITMPSTTSTTSGSDISTPSPIQTGMVSTCDDFYKVIPNDSCYDIASNHSIPLSSFYDWNPAVKTDCSGLEANEYVCVWY